MLDHYLKAVYWFWSSIYDRWIDKLFHFDRGQVIAQLDLRPGQNILEVGVGTGLNLPYYPKGCTVSGIDLSPSMVEKARQKPHQANVKLLLADASSTPFNDDLFDHAVATYLLRVSSNPRAILKEVSRTVKNGGKFAILDQFKGEDSVFSFLLQPFTFMLGWGKDYAIEELVSETDWQIAREIPLNSIGCTRLIILKNCKQ